MRRLFLLMFAAAALVSGEEAFALDCGDDPSPFEDVFYYDSFCTDAVWAKNANITKGCADGSIFCPNDPVTRAQMVLFLRRMAEATYASAILTESAAAPSGDLDGPGVAACTTASAPVSTGNLHFAHVVAVVWLHGGADAAEVQLALSRSFDGTTFLPVGTGVGSVVTVPAGQWVTATVMGLMIADAGLIPGASSQWRIDLSRLAGSVTTGELAGLRCQLKVFRTMA